MEPRAASHEYSFPSSHAMHSFALASYFWGAAALAAPWALAAMVALSRVYEGMHYVHDVVVGAALGAALGPALLALLDAWHARAADAALPPPAALLALRLAAVACVGLLVAAAYRAVRDAPVDPRWAANVRSQLHGQRLDPHWVPLLAYVGMVGVLAGLVVGEVAFYAQPEPRLPLLIAAPRLFALAGV